MSTFPDVTSSFLNNPDPFLNPVGTLIPHMLETLFDQITGEMDQEKIISGLDDFIKIRAVQECAPSQALGFLLFLKKLSNPAIYGSALMEASGGDMNILENRINDVLLKSFDLYMKCRENIYTIRINEFKKKAFRVLENIQ